MERWASARSRYSLRNTSSYFRSLHTGEDTFRNLRHNVVFRIDQFGDVVLQRRGEQNGHFAVVQFVVFLDPGCELGSRDLNRIGDGTADAEGYQVILRFGANLPAQFAFDEID